VRVPPFSGQAITTLLILLVCGGLVIYPVVFLVEGAAVAVSFAGEHCALLDT
jgi:hypothetical protein